jgi:hypothetical protein
MARLLRQARLLGVAFLCALGLMVVGVQPAAAATTWYVDSTIRTPIPT